MNKAIDEVRAQLNEFCREPREALHLLETLRRLFPGHPLVIVDYSLGFGDVTPELRKALEHEAASSAWPPMAGRGRSRR